MNFVVIEGSPERMLIDLKREERIIEVVLKKKHTTIDLKERLKIIKRKINAVKNYIFNQQKITQFEKMKFDFKLDKNVEKYIKKCNSLCVDIKGISFDKRDLLFVVRKSWKGKRHFIGSFDHIDDAIEALNNFTNTLENGRG